MSNEDKRQNAQSGKPLNYADDCLQFDRSTEIIASGRVFINLSGACRCLDNQSLRCRAEDLQQEAVPAPPLLPWFATQSPQFNIEWQKPLRWPMRPVFHTHLTVPAASSCSAPLSIVAFPTGFHFSDTAAGLQLSFAGFALIVGELTDCFVCPSMGI